MNEASVCDLHRRTFFVGRYCKSHVFRRENSHNLLSLMENRIQQTIDEVFDLYARHGSDDYIGEAISQIEHASQGAQLAEKAGHEDEVILAAFFHDIGHICVKVGAEDNMGGYGVKSHEKIGADYLRERGFSEKMAQLVENHVQAKRFLTFKNPEYYRKLSLASKKTLEYQGGPMTAEEAATFEADPLYALSLKMRAWDELAKDVDVPLIDMEILKTKARTHLLAQV